MGQFPAQAPPTIRAALLRGRLSVEQLVDRYTIANQAVRALLIEYFGRRAVDTDYSTLSSPVLALAHHFWEKIEAINPGQAALRIAPEVYAAWRQQVTVRADGKPRATSSTSSSRSAASTTTCTPGPPRNPSAGDRGWRRVRCRPAR
jgi:hypothetical protein